MKPLVVPKKNLRNGIKVYCNKCNKQVSNSCGLTHRKIDSCQFTTSHKFKAVIHIPGSDYKRRSRLMNSRNFEEALKEMIEYKEELRKSNYQPEQTSHDKRTSYNLLVELSQDFIDFNEGVQIPQHLKRTRSQIHIHDITRVLLRLSTSLKKQGYNLETLKIERVGDHEVGLFHNYLLDELSLGKSTYNRHIRIINSFYKWLEKHKGLQLKNPFARIELRKSITVPKIITNEEFKSLLKIITKENGLKQGEREGRNRYREYLKDAFHLALQTGFRREELARLKWNNIIELEKEVEVIKVENLKVNRIMTGEDIGEHQRYIPMTRSLKRLLVTMGYDNKKGTDQYIIERQEGMDMMYFMESLSRGFGHYFKQVSDRGLQFKDLRKTYITRMTEELGSNAKIFTGHTNDEVLKGHYIAGEYTAAKLNDLELFGER